MKLVDLNPRWVGYGGEGVTDAQDKPVPARERVGVQFDCPCGCSRPIFIPFTNPPDGGPPIDQPPRPTWERTGDTFETLTLKPSILRMEGCKWHGFITDGSTSTV